MEHPLLNLPGNAARQVASHSSRSCAAHPVGPLLNGFLEVPDTEVKRSAKSRKLSDRAVVVGHVFQPVKIHIRSFLEHTKHRDRKERASRASDIQMASLWIYSSEDDFSANNASPAFRQSPMEYL